MTVKITNKKTFKNKIIVENPFKIRLERNIMVEAGPMTRERRVGSVLVRGYRIRLSTRMRGTTLHVDTVCVMGDLSFNGAEKIW